MVRNCNNFPAPNKCLVRRDDRLQSIRPRLQAHASEPGDAPQMANVLSSAAAIGSRPRVADRVEAAARTDAMPWYVWSMLAAVTSVMTGEYWDISWHISVGRDTFWTPAHMLIQFAAVIA